VNIVCHFVNHAGAYEQLFSSSDIRINRKLILSFRLPDSTSKWVQLARPHIPRKNLYPISEDIAISDGQRRVSISV
jgi:hypothetical protein